MSFAPIVSRTRSRLRSAWRRCALASSSLSSSICAGELPGQAVLVPGLGHSLMRWLPRKPASILAPEQPSGRKVTAIWAFSTASAERGAHLIAVERAMAGAAFPARALPRPGLAGGFVADAGAAGLVAGEAVAPGPVIFAAHGRRESAGSRSLRSTAAPAGRDCLRRPRSSRPSRRSGRRAPRCRSRRVARCRQAAGCRRWQAWCGHRERAASPLPRSAP